MKKIFLLSFLSAFFLTGCMEAPMRYRPPTNPIQEPGFGSNSGSGSGSNPITSPGTTSGSTSGTTTGGTTTEPGFESCDLTYKYHTIDIGHFGLCQNKYDPTSIRVRFNQTSPSVRVCLVPTYKDASGSSTYIGEPQCTLVKNSGETIPGKILNNRPGYQDRPVNGVMVMKEPLLQGYIACMHSVTNWPANVCPKGAQTSTTCYNYYLQCPNGATSNQGCYNEAINYKNYICNDFKNRYSDSYADIRLY